MHKITGGRRGKVHGEEFYLRILVAIASGNALLHLKAYRTTQLYSFNNIKNILWYPLLAVLSAGYMNLEGNNVIGYPVIGEHERGSQRPGMQSEEVSVQETVSCTYRSQVPARVGLLGNPSDGFKGKTLSLLIKNFCATVELRVHDNPADNTIEIVPHARFDRFNYNGSFFTDSIIYSRSHSICYRY